MERPEARAADPDRGGQAVTWTKLSEDFPEDCARVGLSDAAVRTHLEGLVWAMRRENDGRLYTRDLGRLADTSDPMAAAAELVAVGFWTQLPDGWQIEHQMEHQPESDVIAARRELSAERQRRKRRKAAGLPDPDPDGDSLLPRDNTRDDQRDDTRDPERSGTERNGSEQEVLRAASERHETRAPEPSLAPTRQPPSAVEEVIGDDDDSADAEFFRRAG